MFIEHKKQEQNVKSYTKSTNSRYIFLYRILCMCLYVYYLEFAECPNTKLLGWQTEMHVRWQAVVNIEVTL